jgi:hypothetical protein
MGDLVTLAAVDILKGKIFGHVLVIRKDMVHITPHQVEALTEHFLSVFILLAKDRYGPLMGLMGAKVCKARAKVMGDASREPIRGVFSGLQGAEGQGR